MIKRGGRGPFHASRTSGHAGDGVTGSSNAKLETLTDNFNDASIDSVKWATGNFYDPSASVTGTVTETTTVGRIVPATNSPGHNGYISQNLYDITGSYAFVKPTGSTTPTGELFYFSIGPDNGHLYVMYKDSSGSLFAAKRVSTTLTTISSATYSSSTHSWWRIRESSGAIFFDYAASTASNPPVSGDWTNLTSAAIDSSAMPDKTAVKVAFGAGTTTGVGAPTGQNFDGLNGAT